MVCVGFFLFFLFFWTSCLRCRDWRSMGRPFLIAVEIQMKCSQWLTRRSSSRRWDGNKSHKLASIEKRKKTLSNYKEDYPEIMSEIINIPQKAKLCIKVRDLNSVTADSNSRQGGAILTKYDTPNPLNTLSYSVSCWI